MWGKRPHPNALVLLEASLQSTSRPRIIIRRAGVRSIATTATCRISRESSPRPADLRLVSQNRDTTLTFDPTTKARLYARTSIVQIGSSIFLNDASWCTAIRETANMSPPAAYGEGGAVESMAAPGSAVSRKTPPPICRSAVPRCVAQFPGSVAAGCMLNPAAWAFLGSTPLAAIQFNGLRLIQPGAKESVPKEVLDVKAGACNSRPNEVRWPAQVYGNDTGLSATPGRCSDYDSRGCSHRSPEFSFRTAGEARGETDCGQTVKHQTRYATFHRRENIHLSIQVARQRPISLVYRL